MELAQPIYLLLLLLLVPYLVWRLRTRHRESALRMSDTFAYKTAPRSWRVRISWLPEVCRLLAFVLLVVALARPQSHNVWDSQETEGIDIMMAMDISVSMLSQDVRPNRMEVAKDVAAEFIASRTNDNIGLTVFAGEAFTQCPLTTDHASLINLLQNVSTELAQHGLIEPGTAIGMGIASAVSRLKDSQAKSKIVILLTDGSNNVGDISPMTAVEIAKQMGVRVYTIGLGSDKKQGADLSSLFQGVTAEEMDVETLRQIADQTGAHFYRATNREELSEIYKDIDKLEKTKLMSTSVRRVHEAYGVFALLAFILLLLDRLLSITILKKLP